MIERYTRPEMGRVWSPENKYRKWLDVEVYACEAWAELGVVPREAVEEIRAKARVDVRRILEIEAEIHHDVVAFTTSVSEQVGEAARYVHYGLTSNDVVDTAQSALLKEAAELLIAGAGRLAAALKEQARRHKDTVQMGRTHGVHAEPITFGLKMALWYAEMQRNIDRLRRARDVIAVGKLSGSVGTYANVEPFVEEYVCRRMGLSPAPVSNQVLQRDRHAEFMAHLAVVAGSLEKFATEIRGLQKTEAREVEEPFRARQKGSSSMPHKRNPEKCERVCGLARLIRGYALSAFENQALWHERDISHSSVERVILPDATIVLDYMLAMMAGIIEDLHVYPENMRANLELTGGLIFSQRVLLALVAKGMSREDAYRVVQTAAMEAWGAAGPGAVRATTGAAGGAAGPAGHGRTKTFRELIAADPEVRRLLTPEELAGCFDISRHLKYVDTIFDRLGI